MCLIIICPYNLGQTLVESKTKIKFTVEWLYSFDKGEVDVSALRDQIKQLEAKAVEQHEIIHEMRVRGNIDPRKDKLYSYRFNPTHSKKKKSEIEISKLRQEVALLRQGMIHN